ncbi:hypothetical protein Tco_1256321 [Tanacetum coccineum]
MLVIKIFSERKKVFRERKKCEKIHAKRALIFSRMEQFFIAGKIQRRKKKGSVTHDLEGYGLEKTCNNDNNLSEIQLEHEKEDEFVVVVVKAVDCMMVVKEIVSRLLEEVEKLEWWFEQDIDEEEEDEEGEGGSEV